MRPAAVGGHGRPIPARALLLLRVAGLAALATAGVALGRGVVDLSNGRARVVEVAGARVTQAEAATAPNISGAPDTTPVFSSSLRSWAVAQPEPATATPAPPSDAATAHAVNAQDVAIADNSQPTASTYVVADGDNLSQIAQRYGIGVDVLANANHITNTNLLTAGMRLTIPSSLKTSEAAGPAAQATATPVQVPTVTSAPVQVPTTRPQLQPGATPLGASSPDAAVRSFYAYLEQGQFDQALGLWSQRMRAAYPPAENINSRFARTQSLTVNRTDVVQLDQTNGQAVVAVDVTEIVGPPSTRREYVGNWYLVRGAAGWLLDQPGLRSS